MVSTTGQIDGGLQNYRVQATGSSSYFNTPDIISTEKVLKTLTKYQIWGELA